MRSAPVRLPIVLVACLVAGCGDPTGKDAGIGPFERYRIPTMAMRPTLSGDYGKRDADRVVVDRGAYADTQSPVRWDVAVFRYPLAADRMFIKRVVGLPGEHLRIHGGDIWVRRSEGEPFRIPPRRRATRDVHSLPVYPQPQPLFSGDKPAAWRPAVPGRWTVAATEFAFRGGARGDLTLTKQWFDLRDIRVALTCTFADGAAGSDSWMRVTWSPGEGTTACVQLRPAGSEAWVDRNGVRTAVASFAAVGGAPVLVELVDGMLYVYAQGEEVAALPDGRRIDDPRIDRDAQSLTVSASGAPLRLNGLQVTRDLHYENTWLANREAERDGVVIPAGHYFVLGDNTRNSSDSRRWHMEQTKLRDGTVIRYESHARRYLDDSYEQLTVTDVDGERRTWREDDEAEDGWSREPAPFVPRGHFVGKVLRVFYPPAFARDIH